MDIDKYTIVSIVEGHGEVAAVPEILRRIAQEEYPGLLLKTPRPIRIAKTKMFQKGEIEKAIALAAGMIGKDNRGGILVLLDADDDCPVEQADILRRRAISALAAIKIFALSWRRWNMKHGFWPPPNPL